LFKLYNDLGVRYPLPTVDVGGEVKGSTSAVLGANLQSLKNALASSSEGAISKVVSETVKDSTMVVETKSKFDKKKSSELLKTVGDAISGINEESDKEDDDIEGVDVAGPLKAALESMDEVEARERLGANLDDDALKRTRLFAGLTFYLSREVPRGYLELVCLAYGGKVGWEGPNSPIAMNDPSITHHIVDRPKLPTGYESLPKSREFIQPQWLLDCSNFMFILPISKYRMGEELPPHLSPWVDNEEEGHKPAYVEEIERLKNGETVEMEESNGEEKAKRARVEVDSSSEEEEEAEGEKAEDDASSTGDVDDDESEDEEEAKKRAEKKRLREVRIACSVNVDFSLVWMCISRWPIVVMLCILGEGGACPCQVNDEPKGCPPLWSHATWNRSEKGKGR
jgi:hypothetical protein